MRHEKESQDDQNGLAGSRASDYDIRMARATALAGREYLLKENG